MRRDGACAVEFELSGFFLQTEKGVRREKISSRGNEIIHFSPGRNLHDCSGSGKDLSEENCATGADGFGRGW